MSAPIPLRRDFGASQLRGLGEIIIKTKTALRPVGFWRSPHSMIARRGLPPVGPLPRSQAQPLQIATMFEC